MAVDETTSVEGWARSGAKVDVVLISTVNGRGTATIIVQNAKVLSGGGPQKEKSGSQAQAVSGTVTLMVTVEEAAKIQLASSTGILSLTLRGDEDTIESINNASISIDSILAGEQGPSKPAEIPSEGKIKIDGREFLIVRGKLVPQ
jgi:Flp pilus assembly protein CpaB